MEITIWFASANNNCGIAVSAVPDRRSGNGFALPIGAALSEGAFRACDGE